MKKILNGKIYNTETAEEVATWRNGDNCSDYDTQHISIYRTKKGAWFLSTYTRIEGESIDVFGTKDSMGYPTIHDNEGNEMTPQAWLEEYDFVEALEKHFANKITEA